MTLKLKTKMLGSTTRITFEGDLDEDVETILAKAADGVTGSIDLVLAGIGSINSCGVREWVKFIRNLQAAGTVTLIDCSVEVVTSLNTVPSFRGKAVVSSVLRDYSCVNCRTTELRRLTAAEHFDGGNLRMPAMSCAKCGAELEADMKDEEYFEFALP